jgi:hypothetical protein
LTTAWVRTRPTGVVLLLLFAAVVAAADEIDREPGRSAGVRGVVPGEAFIEVTPTGGINASTFNSSAFRLRNDSEFGGPRIASIRLNLASSIFPDIVFDPVGAAGDATAKCLTPDAGEVPTGYLPPADPCVDPFSLPHDGGYDEIGVNFADFDRGETFNFSVDVDPTSIQTAGGAGGAGSVSGLELTGTVVTVEFEGGEIVQTTLFRQVASESGGQNIVKAGGPAAPTLEIVGLPATPATVSDPNQTVRVTAPVGSDVRLLVVEGALDLGAATGFDLDPFEANTVILIQEFSGAVGGTGSLDFGVVLTRSNDEGGLNHIVAVVEDADGSGRTGPTSNVAIVELADAVNLGVAPASLDFGQVFIDTASAPQTVTLTHLGQAGEADITLTGVSVSGEYTHDLTLETLAPGASVDVDITFAPTAVGISSGTLTVEHDGGNSPVTVALSGEGLDPTPVPISFSSSDLQGEFVDNPTSLDFGPDGRLYVSQQDGELLAYTITRNGPTDYQVTDTETIDLVMNIPNHDDDGSPAAIAVERQVTGLLAAGTATNPVLYVASSDPRIGAGAGGSDLNLDTNSGIVSRLTWNGSSWDMVHLVRGLPRSEENHATNGMQLDAAANVLYVMSGGNTNKGAPSNNFAQAPEYALAAALLTFDLAAIDAMPTQIDGEGQAYKYDLPTLDDPTRDPDTGDPFGGNDGRNQAIIVPGGPVQVYSPGFRNAYDVVRTQSGRLYTFDNGPNSGWGGIPVGEGTAACTNETNESDSTGYSDGLHYISGPGYYAGHPHPTRGNPETSGLFIYEKDGGSWTLAEQYDWQTDFPVPPVPLGTGNPVECDYLVPGVEDGTLATISSSTNGITEYTALNFGGAMQGNLLAASFGGSIYRFQLNAAGDDLAVPHELLFTGFGSQPLDVTAQGSGDVFPGTIWVAVYGSDKIAVFEPTDSVGCTGADDPGLDEDGDGYTNADEIDNNTDPCSGGSKPDDNDGDFVSDLNDPDDDDDGIPDVSDAFAIDADNGTTTLLPVLYPFFNADPGTGFFGLGFTGLMTNGVTDWLDQFDENFLAAGGAAGLFTVEQVTEGDALGASNDQEHGFQFGVAVDSASEVFSVRTRLLSPYFQVGGAQSVPIDFQSYGLVLGAGDQDNYAKVVLNAQGGAGGIEVVLETGGIASGTSYDTAVVGDVLGSIFIDLYFTVDPAALTVQPQVALDDAPIVNLGAPLAIPASWLDPLDARGLAVGVISTASGSGVPFGGTWELFEVTPGAAGVECLVDGDCDDGEVCTTDSCTAGACEHAPVAAGVGCETDGSLCTVDECNGSGACVTASTVSCPPGEICNPSTGVCEVLAGDGDNDAIDDGIDPCPGDPRNLCFGPVAVDGTTGTEVRINTAIGGTCSGSRVDCNGDTWVDDFGATTGLGFACDLGNGCPIAGLDAIFGPGCDGDGATEDIFQCERYDAESAPNMIYSFDLADGSYIVNLLFANAWSGSVNEGSRVFDILIEGALVHDDFDQVAAAAGNATAVVRSAVIDVVDGDGLQIEFVHGVQNPAIKGIEVLGPVGCVLDAECADGDACTYDVCTAGSCSNPPILAPPSVDGLLVNPSGGATELSWSPAADAASYDVVRGGLGMLRFTDGSFDVSLTDCLAEDQPSTTLLDGDAPQAGTGYWYLVRGANCAGSGTYDSGYAGQQGTRDAEIDASPSSCL